MDTNKLFEMSDEDIINSTDPLVLGKITALGVKRISEAVNGWPRRTSKLSLQMKGVWAVISVVLSVLIYHIAR